MLIILVAMETVEVMSDSENQHEELQQVSVDFIIDSMERFQQFVDGSLDDHRSLMYLGRPNKCNSDYAAMKNIRLSPCKGDDNYRWLLFKQIKTLDGMRKMGKDLTKKRG